MIAVSLFGLTTGFGTWPALVVSVVVGVVVGLVGWLVPGRLALRPWPDGGLRRLAALHQGRLALPRLPTWMPVVLWGVFGVVVGLVATRP